MILLIALLLLAGCGETAPERDASDAALVDAAAAGSNEASDELERRDETSDALDDALEALRARGFDVGEARESGRERRDEVDRLEDDAADRQFAETDVDRALDRLPLRKPPLDVLQWVLTDTGDDLVDADPEQRKRVYELSARERKERFAPKPSHEVHARVDRDAWYGMTREQRARAVRSFYREAQKAFAAEGIDDLVLIVAPLNETTEHLPPLAVGRDGKAALTPLGRQRRAPQL